MKYFGIHKVGARIWAVAAAMIVLAVCSQPSRAADLAHLRNGFTIRHEHRQVLGEITRLYFDSGNSSYIDVKTDEIDGFEKDLSPPPRPNSDQPSTSKSVPVANLSDIVNSASAERHLDPDLVNSVIHAESGFNSHAVSPKGAQGLMQLMPSTAGHLGVKNAFDPEANVGGGTQYLRQLLEQYNFDLVKALAAYNAGPQRVDKYHGVPPYRETQAYVARIVREYNKKKIAEEKQAAAQQKQAAHPKQAVPKIEKQAPQQTTSTAEVQSTR